MWEANSFKIALPYVHDYLYSIVNNDNNCKSTGSCLSWMTYSNSYKTMTSCGYRSNSRIPCGLYYVDKSGNMNSNNSIPEQYYSDSLVVRPVFYLTPDIILKEGTIGTKDNPYILDIE